MDFLGNSVCCLGRRWSKIGVEVLLDARLTPSPAVAVDSHRSGYRARAHAQFEQSIGSGKKHVERVVGLRLTRYLYLNNSSSGHVAWCQLEPSGITDDDTLNVTVYVEIVKHPIWSNL